MVADWSKCVVLNAIDQAIHRSGLVFVCGYRTRWVRHLRFVFSTKLEWVLIFSMRVLYFHCHCLWLHYQPLNKKKMSDVREEFFSEFKLHDFPTHKIYTYVSLYISWLVKRFRLEEGTDRENNRQASASFAFIITFMFLFLKVQFWGVTLIIVIISTERHPLLDIGLLQGNRLALWIR